MHSTYEIRNVPEDRDQTACSCIIEEKRKGWSSINIPGGAACATHTCLLSPTYLEWLKTHAEAQRSVWRVIMTPELEVIPGGVILIDFFMAIRRTLQVLAHTGTVEFSSVFV